MNALNPNDSLKGEVPFVFADTKVKGYVRFDYGEHDKDKPAIAEIDEWPARLKPFSYYRSGFDVYADA